MAGIIWTENEEKILIQNYGRQNKNIVQNLLPNRTWAAIKLHARFLRVKYFTGIHNLVEADLTSLLDNNPEAIYWMGFLAADGYFHKNRLTLTLAKNDVSHLMKFANFIKCENCRDVKNGCSLSVQDSHTVPKIVKKYNLKARKTYNPPNISWMNADICLPFFIGFVDGDGSIGFQYGRKDCILRIKNHSSWMPTLQQMIDIVCTQAGTLTPIVKLNNKGYAEVNIANSITLKFLKNITKNLKLPVLKRKWDKIDETLVSRVEKAICNKENVLELKKQGMKNVKIASLLGLSNSAVSIILKKSQNLKGK